MRFFKKKCFFIMKKEKIMLEIKGSYAEARVFCDTLDDASIAQIYQVCNQECVKDSKIAIMSDVHMGSSCCVGTTMTIDQYVIPSLVGVDIGCGMEVVKLKEKHIELARLDTFIHQHIPSGCTFINKNIRIVIVCIWKIYTVIKQ